MTRGLGLAALACGCAMRGAAAPPATAAPRSFGTEPSPRSAALAAGAPAAAGSAAPTEAPADDAARASGLARWEAQLRAGEAALAASVNVCRTICQAAADVCVAAGEICLLTGDAPTGAARDVRCGRARAACVAAGRRRDAACPLCPPR
jgi:hypothetical protein